MRWAWESERFIFNQDFQMFIDDGPYYSSEFSEPNAELPINSQIELRRFGQSVYSLESRVLPSGDNSVLVLRDAGGKCSGHDCRLHLQGNGNVGIKFES
ncbi:MAG TPA: hypothetical protein VJ984_15385 [Xanthomonadales bacterium]|nr:hypothetical protein [Xanthomonadales bacterium]